MCVIIYSRVPSRISDKALENFQGNNPDGAGGMYYEGDKLVVERSLSDGATLYRVMAREAEAARSPLAFHFRKRTTGEITGVNCHPFESGSGFLMHNGTVEALRPREEEPESDSFRLAQLVADIEAETGKTPATSKAVRRIVSLLARGNRLLYASREGTSGKSMVMLNPGLWTWVGVHAISNLYAWDAHRITQGRFGSAEMDKERAQKRRQLALF